MPKTIRLSTLTADFEGGSIEEWHKAVGDRIEVGDIIVDVSTDKAVIEMEAEYAGILGKILADAGPDEVAVDEPIAVLLLDGETQDDMRDFNHAAEVVVDSEPTSEGRVESSLQTEPHQETVSNKGDRVFASPVAVRIASQLGVDLTVIEGSGPDGRIVLGDVEAIAETQAALPQTTIEMPLPGSFEAVPADKVRTVIARRLSEAKRDIPHFYLTVDCELDSLLTLRSQVNDAAVSGSKISVNDFIVKACAMALAEVPGVNTGWANETLFRFTGVNVAVAVATPKGLITPVIFGADKKDLATISGELTALVSRAKEGRLKPEEYKGGSFTLSNLGMYGVREFAAIINPPQSCILAVGKGEQRAVVKDGAVTVATVMSCTLSVDHRAVDGALGAEFLQSIKGLVEQPDRLVG